MAEAEVVREVLVDLVRVPLVIAELVLEPGGLLRRGFRQQRAQLDCAVIDSIGDRFGALVKIEDPVWRTWGFCSFHRFHFHSSS